MKIDLKNPTNWIPKNIFKSYCGTNSDKLVIFYDKAVEKRKMNAMSLYWMAIILLPAWLGYRKQWAILITITAIFSIFPFIEAIFDMTIPSAGFTGGLIAIGLMCNGLLLMNANKEFLKLKQRGMDEDQICRALKNRVSPSVGFAIASLILYLVFVIGSVFLADILFSFPS